MEREIIYSVRGPKNLAEMTWEEVSEILEKTDMVVLPVGSTEEHGPHMPLGADTIQGTEVSRRIVTRLESEGVQIAAGPPIPFGVSLQLMDFPGTITLSPATLQNVVQEVCNSLIKHGFRKIVLLLAHAENLGATYSAIQELSQQPEVQLLFLNWLPILGKHYPEILKSKGGGHGGEGETARVLAVCPELVQMDRAVAYNPERSEKLEFDQPMHLGGAVFDPPKGMKEETPVGSLGDTTVSTAETGERCYEVIVDWSCQVIKRHFGF
jgi:creatinine amidohydrolase